MDLIDAQKLGLAVLRQAVVDLKDKNDYIRNHAANWLEGTSESFLFWCKVLKIDPVAVIGEVKKLDKKDLVV